MSGGGGGGGVCVCEGVGWGGGRLEQRQFAGKGAWGSMSGRWVGKVGGRGEGEVNWRMIVCGGVCVREGLGVVKHSKV